jgi:taurine dioxygenase
MSLVIQPVSPHIGAEVIGADLRQPMGDNLFRQLYRAWVDGDRLPVIRDQAPTPVQQVAFSRQVRWRADDRTHLQEPEISETL